MYLMLWNRLLILKMFSENFEILCESFVLLLVTCLIIQAEKFLNADWLKRAVFISNTCHSWERV